MKWQPIETAPDQQLFDVWIKSKHNPSFSRRACNVCVVDGVWFGQDSPIEKYGEYVTHWMQIPQPPEE